MLAPMLAFCASDASAQYRGTEEQRQACTPDVFRLCSSEIPDVGRIVVCLKRNRAHLSPACRAAFYARRGPLKHR